MLKSAALGLGVLALFAVALGWGSQDTTAPEVLWTKIFGTPDAPQLAKKVRQTSDGGYVLVGAATRPGAGHYAYLIKTDPSGNLQWEKDLGEGQSDWGFDVQQTSDGGYIIAGGDNASGDDQDDRDFNRNADVCLIKTDAFGNVEWEEKFGGAKADKALRVQQTSDGGYIVIGVTASFGNGKKWDIYLLKTDSSGNLEWQRTFGAEGEDWGQAVQQTSDGGYILAGHIQVGETKSKQNEEPIPIFNVYVVRIDSANNLIWEKRFGGSETNAKAHAIEIAPDGGYIVAGTIYVSEMEFNDFYLLKIDTDGNMVWEKTFGTPGSSENLWDLDVTADRGYILAGETMKGGMGSEDLDVLVVRTDAGGNDLWTMTIKEPGTGQCDWARGVQQTSDGGYILAGMTTFSDGDKDAYLIKLSSDSRLRSVRPSLGRGSRRQPNDPTQATLLFTIGMHIEPLGTTHQGFLGGSPENDYRNEKLFQNHVEDIRAVAAIVEAHGGRMTIQSQSPFTDVLIERGNTILADLVARGHEIGLHFHEDAHLGQDSKSLPVSRWCDVLKQEIGLIYQAGVNNHVRYWSGGNLYPNLLEAANCAELDVNSDWKNPRTQSTDPVLIGINPWRPAGGVSETEDVSTFALHDPNGKIIFLPEGNYSRTDFANVRHSMTDEEYFEFLKESLERSVEAARPDRVNVFHFTVHPGEFRGSDRSFSVIEQFLANVVDPLVASGKVRWATFSQMADAFIEWEEAHPGVDPRASTDEGQLTHPFYHQIYSATSSDGLNWVHDNRLLLDHASVPTAIVTPEGNIRIYYVDATQRPETTNCAESSDGGLTFKVLGCTIANRTTEKALDPSIVRLPDGRYRLYYYGMAVNPRLYSYGMAVNPDSLPHTIYSAISEDGIHFIEEKAVFSYPGLVDPDVFWTGREWLMLVFSLSEKATIVARSRDGLSFEYAGPFSVQRWGTTAPVKLDDGRFRLYAFDQPAAQRVASFISADGVNWTQEPGVRLMAPPGYHLTDPFVIRLPDGSWKMIFKIGRGGAIQPQPPPGNPSQITGAYLMAFHACDSATADCRDTRNHRVYLAQSDDGANWSLVPNWTPYPGSVPDVIRRGDTLYIYTPGQVRRYRFATQTWESPVQVSLNDPSAPGFVDPSLFVDDQGRLVLFFLYDQIGSDPARCPPGQATCIKRFGSATEVPGSDGTRFTIDSGDRVSVFLDGSTIRTASDPDIFHDASQYILYISLGPSVQVYTSSSFRGSYTAVTAPPNGILSQNLGGIPAGHYDITTGKYWTFVHTQENGKSVIRRAVHADLNSQLTASQYTTIMSGSSLGLGSSYNIESPGFAVNTPAPVEDQLITTPGGEITGSTPEATYTPRPTFHSNVQHTGQSPYK